YVTGPIGRFVYSSVPGGTGSFGLCAMRRVAASPACASTLFCDEELTSCGAWAASTAASWVLRWWCCCELLIASSSRPARDRREHFHVGFPSCQNSIARSRGRQD